MNENTTEEYDKLKNIIENETNNFYHIKNIITYFQKNISNLKDEIKNSPQIENSSFQIIFEFFKNFANDLQKNLNHFSDYVLSPLDNLIECFKFAAERHLNQVKEIENQIHEDKQNLLNKRDVYAKHIKDAQHEKRTSKSFYLIERKNSFNQNSLPKKDENILSKAVKENYTQLYQYELNKMNETIDEYNIKYNNINKELNAIITSLKVSIIECLNRFSSYLNKFSESFIILSKDIEKNANSLIIENDNQEIKKFSVSYDEFSLESKDFENEEESKRFSFREKIKFFNIFAKKNNNDNIEEKKNKEHTGKEKKESKENKEKENKEFIDYIIKVIVEEKEIKSTEILDLFNILIMNKNNSKEENIYVKLFLNKLKKFHNNRVVSLKNRKNFIHLSNIMNNLCLNYQNNPDILILIIIVSQKLKYRNDYIYKIIQGKNNFLSTKSLWLKLIDDNIMENLNNYVQNELLKRTEEKNAKDDDKNDIFTITGLSKKILHYKKLSGKQKRELLKYGKNQICIILSKSISGMCCFLVPEIVINEIIAYYGGQFKLEYEFKNYLKNKMLLKNMKIRNQIRNCPEKEEILYNKIIFISSVTNFFKIKEIPQFLKLNKQLYKTLKKKIFLNLLSDKNLSIDSHLKLWKEYLEIENLKKKFKYKDIKEVIYISVDNNKINEEIREEKNINVIEKDLLRTVFLNENKEHFNILKSILISFLFLYPKIGYCQGMHYIASFLYQLLDYNEEETFYFFCAFQLNTEYKDIFEDDFVTLKRFFQIFDYILNINKPEIYYKFYDCHIITNCYLPAWFITLFSENVRIFNKNNVPKFIFFLIEKFIIEGWSVIFNCGFTLLEYYYDKIMALEKDKLMIFIMDILEDQEIVKNENFEKLKNLYLKNSRLINEFFIEKLKDITIFEEKNIDLIEDSKGI